MSSNGYINIKKPVADYHLPQLNKPQTITAKIISGDWYGTTSVGFNFLGFHLKVKVDDVKTSSSVTL